MIVADLFDMHIPRHLAASRINFFASFDIQVVKKMLGFLTSTLTENSIYFLLTSN
ncbi:hypothetical protein Patl1_10670 [Pistacia atlantica]|uniref:Uncharacterized protein n=1 Tax=Pistacia atlantica TaxID=434234 RepID=A0ACC1A4E8_9ROSI|nr:hypothetical protein Patl1_10670 [Pistacia atlantica]